MSSDNQEPDHGEDSNDQRSFFNLLLDALSEIWKDFNVWMSPDPGEHWTMKGLKFIGKMVGVLVFIAFSPVILTTLIIAFIIAF